MDRACRAVRPVLLKIPCMQPLPWDSFGRSWSANIDFLSSCEATDGTDVVLIQEAGEEEGHDHSEEDHSGSNSTTAAVPTEVENCHAHEDGIYCFAGENEWEITSENAANYDGQSLTACEASASSNTTM